MREALDRHRTNATTALPNEFRTHLGYSATRSRLRGRASRETRSPRRTGHRYSEFVHSPCSPTSSASWLRKVCGMSSLHLATKLLSWIFLEKWAVAASRSGVGGDASAIRLALAGKARLVEPPSYREDVRRLRAYSDAFLARLKRFTELPTPEGQVNIARPVANVVAEAARRGALVITGDPGAGKSAVTHQVAIQLATEASVLAFTVEASATSLDALRREIGLSSHLLDVLGQIPGDRPASTLSWMPSTLCVEGRPKRPTSDWSRKCRSCQVGASSLPSALSFRPPFRQGLAAAIRRECI